MSVACEYKNDRQAIMCHFGCCANGCCMEEHKPYTLSTAKICFLLVFATTLSVLTYLIINYCSRRQSQKQTDLSQQSIDESRPSSTISILLEEEVDLSLPAWGKHELLVTKGPPAYEEGTKAPPSFEEATRLAPGSDILERGHSGNQRLENVKETARTDECGTW